MQDAPHFPNGIVPRARVTMLNDADADKDRCVPQALFMMSKIDIARLQHVYNPQ